MIYVHSTDSGAVHPWEYMPATAGTYQAGQMLTTKNGVLSPVSAAMTTTPGYICMANITVAEGDNIPVTRIQKDAVYETQLSAKAESAAIGAKLQVSAGGLQVDAAAAGTFELTYVDGTEAGNMVRGRFV